MSKLDEQDQGARQPSSGVLIPQPSPSAGASSIDADDRPSSASDHQREYLWNVHEYLQEAVHFSDTKSALLIVFCTGLLATLFSSGLHRNLPRLGYAPILSVVCFMLLGLAIALAGWSIRPRLFARKSFEQGYIFWETICKHGTAGAFADDFRRQSDERLIVHLATQVFAVAEVCHAKYLWFNRAFVATLVGGAIAALLVLHEEPAPTDSTERNASSINALSPIERQGVQSTSSQPNNLPRDPLVLDPVAERPDGWVGRFVTHGLKGYHFRGWEEGQQVAPKWPRDNGPQ